MNTLAATKAVAFAEDTHFDASLDVVCGDMSPAVFNEIRAALAQVRRIAAGNIQPVESA